MKTCYRTLQRHSDALQRHSDAALQLEGDDWIGDHAVFFVATRLKSAAVDCRMSTNTDFASNACSVRQRPYIATAFFVAV